MPDRRSDGALHLRLVVPAPHAHGVARAGFVEESFRLFQGRVVDAYDEMVKEFGLVVIDASRSIEEQQAEMRAIVTKALIGARKTRIRRWVDLHSMAKASRQLNQAS